MKCTDNWLCISKNKIKWFELWKLIWENIPVRYVGNDNGKQMLKSIN